MNDLSWVTKTAVVPEGDPAHQAMLDNPGWVLLHVTGGLHGPVQFVHGWPAPDDSEARIEDVDLGCIDAEDDHCDCYYNETTLTDPDGGTPGVCCHCGSNRWRTQ